MQKISQEQFIKRFQSLPESLQNILFSDSSTSAVKKATVFAEIEDKSTILAELVGQVILGYLNPLDLQKEIQNELGISEEIAAQVYSQLNSEIFGFVENDLRKLYPPTIKTPTVSSRGFTPGEKPKEVVEQSGPSAFEKRFLKKSTAATPSTPTPRPTGAQYETKSENIEASVSTPAYTKTTLSKPPYAKNSIDKKEEAKPLPKTPIPAEQARKEVSKPRIPQIKVPEARPVLQEKMATEETSNKTKEMSPESLIKKDKMPAVKITQKREDAKPKEIVKEEKDEIAPVMPLPTFMQSQFQPKQTESPYREKVPEQKLKPKNEDLEKKSAPKLSGNVIDLRDL